MARVIEYPTRSSICRAIRCGLTASGACTLQVSNDGMENLKPVKRDASAATKVDPVQMLLSGLDSSTTVQNHRLTNRITITEISKKIIKKVMKHELDLYIRSHTPVKHRGTGVFIRDNGQTRELKTIEEVKAHFPDADTSDIDIREWEDDELFHCNMTHNLTEMASHVPIEGTEGV